MSARLGEQCHGGNRHVCGHRRWGEHPQVEVADVALEAPHLLEAVVDCLAVELLVLGGAEGRLFGGRSTMFAEIDLEVTVARRAAQLVGQHRREFHFTRGAHPGRLELAPQFPGELLATIGVDVTDVQQLRRRLDRRASLAEVRGASCRCMHAQQCEHCGLESMLHGRLHCMHLTMRLRKG